MFSHLSAKKTLQDSAANEAGIEELTNLAVNELQLKHPITYEVYNLCDMAARSKLNNFSISVLKDNLFICLFFNIDISDVSVHRKPYLNKIQSLCPSCNCQQ